jgi:hypothetical protein
MRIGREPSRVKVIRDDSEASVEPPATNAAPPPVVEAPAPNGGRFARMVRASLDRLRRR